jgi:hypothetical protein
MGGIHDILVEDDGVWVTCTASDLLLKLDWEGQVRVEWEWRQDRGLRQALGLPGVRPIRRELDYRDPSVARDAVSNTVHLNGVSRCPEGLLLSFGRILSRRNQLRRRVQGAIARSQVIKHGLSLMGRRSPAGSPHQETGRVAGSSYALVRLSEAQRADVLLRTPNVTVPNHNAIWIDGWVVYNDTNASEVAAVCLDTGERRSVTIPGLPPFVRGLQHLGGFQFLVGAQRPAAVYRVDVMAQRVLGGLDLGGSATEAVYGIATVPDGFDAVDQLDLEAGAIRQA